MIVTSDGAPFWQGLYIWCGGELEVRGGLDQKWYDVSLLVALVYISDLRTDSQPSTPKVCMYSVCTLCTTRIHSARSCFLLASPAELCGLSCL